MAKKLNRKHARLHARIKDWDKCSGKGACSKHTHRKPGSMKK